MDGQWTEEDAAIVAKARDLEWRQGDRLRHAISVETERGSAKAAAAVATRRDASELTRIIKVCEAFAETRRRYDLTFCHHDAVLKLATDAERDDMLARAAENGWSARQTRRAVLATRIDTGQYLPAIDDDPVDTGVRNICQAWNRAPAESRELFFPLAEEAGTAEIDV